MRIDFSRTAMRRSRSPGWRKRNFSRFLSYFLPRKRALEEKMLSCTLIEATASGRARACGSPKTPTPAGLVLRMPLAAAAALLLAAAGASAGAERVQTLQLEAGWNAVFLDVDPADDAVEAVFDPELVDVVARYFEPTSSVRFITDPAEEPWKEPGWGVWYGPRRAESFLSNLHAAHGGVAYLVHAVKAGTLSVRGEAGWRPPRWKGDSFNLVGFPVDALGMSFAEYFGGAGQRIGVRVYRLREGSWRKVTDLAGTRIRPGEACWVYCEGNTRYPGPLELRGPGARGIGFAEGGLSASIELHNRGNAPFSVVASLEANEGLPLYRRIAIPSELSSVAAPLSAPVSLGTLAPGQVDVLRLELREELLQGLQGAGGSAILKLSASNGVVLRVPIRYLAD